MPSNKPFACTQGRRRCRRGGFTLIEMMVTIGIIVILAAIAMVVGVQVKRGSQERATKTTLTTLDGVMGKYLEDGNAEPVFTGIRPGAASDPKADPYATRWVAALESVPDAQKALSGQKVDLVNNNVVHVLDAYGNPIFYIPRDVDPRTGNFTKGAKTPGRFASLGPDGYYGPNPNDNSRDDDIYSNGVQ